MDSLKLREMTLSVEARLIDHQRKRVERKLAKLRAKGKKVENTSKLSGFQFHRAIRRHQIRHLKLARAYMKGTPHLVCETAPKNPVERDDWYNYLKGTGAYNVARIVRDTYDPKHKNVTPDAIREWLSI